MCRSTEIFPAFLRFVLPFIVRAVSVSRASVSEPASRRRLPACPLLSCLSVLTLFARITCHEALREPCATFFAAPNSLATSDRLLPPPLLARGHTAANTPDLFRTPKLTAAGPGQYWGGGPPGKSFGCCELFPTSLKPLSVLSAKFLVVLVP